MASSRKKKQEATANTVMDFVVEEPPVVVSKPKPVKVNGDDYFIVKITGIQNQKSQHPVTGWKLASWLKFYDNLNSVDSVEYELTTKEVYNTWMYSPIEESKEDEVVIKKPRKKRGTIV